MRMEIFLTTMDVIALVMLSKVGRLRFVLIHSSLDKSPASCIQYWVMVWLLDQRHVMAGHPTIVTVVVLTMQALSLVSITIHILTEQFATLLAMMP